VSIDDQLDGSEVAQAGLLARRLTEAVRDAVEVRAEVLEDLLVCILAEGHVLSTRSTAPRPRRSPGCWSACRSGA
jgi:hypothetical protein